MKVYLSDHARLVKVENEIKALAAVLHHDIVSSDPVTLPLNQTLGKVGDFIYTTDEILQAASLWIDPDNFDDNVTRKVRALIHVFDAWKHCSGK